jgi:Cu/Ag efflux pump CusA
LCFVLIGGLISSTFLVLTAFPAMYLGIAAVRSRTRRLFGRQDAFAAR